MSVKVILFDFDGTIADTLDAVTRITNHLAEEFGYKPITSEELAHIRNLSSREIVQQSRISLFKLPFLLRRLKTGLRENIQELNLIVGVKEALTQLKNAGYILGILTSNSEENVRVFLEKHNMQELFSCIHPETKLFSKHKAIGKFMQTNNLNSQEVIYVGDETRDIEASKRIQIQVIAVSWGFNTAAALAKHQPDFLIHQPNELMEVMRRLQKKVEKAHGF